MTQFVKKLAWNLYTVSYKVLENTKQANIRSFSTDFMISVTDANLLTLAEMKTCSPARTTVMQAN